MLLFVLGAVLLVTGAVVGVFLIVIRRRRPNVPDTPERMPFGDEDQEESKAGAPRASTVLPRRDRSRFRRKDETEMTTETDPESWLSQDGEDGTVLLAEHSFWDEEDEGAEHSGESEELGSQEPAHGKPEDPDPEFEDLLKEENDPGGVDPDERSLSVDDGRHGEEEEELPADEEQEPEVVDPWSGQTGGLDRVWDPADDASPDHDFTGAISEYIIDYPVAEDEATDHEHAESGVESVPMLEPLSGPELEFELEPEPGTEQEGEPGPEYLSGPDPYLGSEPAPDPMLEPDPDLTPDPDLMSESFSEPEPEPAPEPAPGPMPPTGLGPAPEPGPVPGLRPSGVPDLPRQGRHEAEHPSAHGPREPSAPQREPLRAAAAQLEGFTGRTEIARIVCDHAADIIGDGDLALLVRSVEGPKILWSRSGSEQRHELWGPETMGTLLMLGVPVREVIPADPDTGEPATAILAVPVPSGGVQSGVLVARRPVTRPFFASEEDALNRLARMAGAAFYAVSRRGWAGDESRTDPVTGFWVVERLLNDLRAALRSAQEHRMPSGLIVAEITGLRSRRRSPSDPTAEAVLFALAEAIGAQLRVGDVAYRTGQDEFAVLLPGTEVEDVRSVEARLRAHLGMMAPGWQIRTGTVPVTGVAEDVLAAARRMVATSEPNLATRPKAETGRAVVPDGHGAPAKSGTAPKSGTATRAPTRSRRGKGAAGATSRPGKSAETSSEKKPGRRGQAGSTPTKASE
jgi:GGDEF domain-containing protein